MLQLRITQRFRVLNIESIQTKYSASSRRNVAGSKYFFQETIILLKKTSHPPQVAKGKGQMANGKWQIMTQLVAESNHAGHSIGLELSFLLIRLEWVKKGVEKGFKRGRALGNDWLVIPRYFR